MTDIKKITDINGRVRKLGLLIPPTGYVCAEPVFESEIPVWSDEDILSTITHPDRLNGRELFAPSVYTHDQGGVGSCCGWGTASGYARARYRRGLRDHMQFSGAWSYSLTNQGRDNGSALADNLQACMSDGCSELSLVPPNQIYPKLQTQRAAAVASAKNHKGFKAYAVKTKQGFRTAVALGFPVIVALSAGPNFQKLKNGVAGVDNGRGNHSVLVQNMIVRDGVELFDVQNSWGRKYGDDGCCYVTWASFNQCFEVHEFFAIASTEEGE